MILSFLANTLFITDGHGEPIQTPLPPIDMQSMAQTGDYGLALVKMFVTMIGILALFFLSYWFLRKLVQGRVSKKEGNYAIQILEKRMISPKTILYLVLLDNKKILIAESQLEIKRLETFPLEVESQE